MLGFILIYFIGKAFYDLASAFERHKWAHAITGIAIYYAGIFAGSFIIGLIGAFYFPEIMDREDSSTDFYLGLLGIPFGLFACWITYRMLKSRWSASADIKDILDGDAMI